MRRLFAAATVVSLGLSAPAIAAPLSANELLHQFNVITFENLNANNHVDGRTYVGGDLVANGAVFNMQPKVPTPASGYDHLVVEGNVTGGQIQLNNSGNASVRGDVTNSWFELNGHGTLTAGGIITAPGNQGTRNPEQGGTEFEARFPQDVASILTAASGQIRAWGGAASAITGTLLTLDATASSVYALTISELNSITDIDLVGVGKDNPLTINVSGAADGLFKANFRGIPNETGQFVLWNFFETGNLDLTTTLVGSILAPNAAVSNINSNIEGTLVARTATLRGEVHLQPFDGAVIPLPAGLPLIASALAGLALLRTRRRRAA